MKRDNGFTLIELLAVIVILAVILAIAIPSIAKVLNSSTISSFESNAKLILQATNYKELENESFDATKLSKSNIDEELGLSSVNYESLKIVLEDRTKIISIVGAGKWSGLVACGTIQRMKIVSNLEDCVYDLVPPSIVILGDNPLNLNLGDTYSEAGATATDNVDGDITSKIIKTGSVDTNVVGTYIITYNVSDAADNAAPTAKRTVNVTDESVPVITLIGSSTITINVGSTYIDDGATATDNIDGDLTSDIVVTGTVNPSVVGTYTVTYNVTDSLGNNAIPVTRTINVADNIVPTVAFGTNGNTTYAKTRSTTVTVTDNESVNASSLKYLWNTSTTAPTEASITTNFTNAGTISSPVGLTGGYYLWILAKDNAGNTTITKTNVFNLDNTKPIITVNGNISVTINKGSIYTDAGATASDNIDGTVTVTSTGSVNPSVTGTYTMTYNATDSSGNAANAVVRTINVVDNSAPVITMIGSNPAVINVGSVYSDAGATALDDVDGNVTSNIVVTGTVNPNVVGSYTITYTVTDNANNTATLTRTVNVIDNIVPTVAFGTNGNSTYAKTRSTTITVSDNVAVNTSSLKYLWNTSITAPSEVTFTTSFTNAGTITSPAGVTGGYYLWVLAKDTAGNTTIIKTNVFNLDNTKPVITLGGSTPVNINVGSVYTDAGATATDSIDGSVTVTSTGSVNPSVIGTYTINYNATDNSGNAANTVTRTVNVIDNAAPTVAFGTNGNATYAKTRSTTVTATDDSGVDTSSLKYLWSTSATPPIEATFTTTFTNGGTLTSPAGVTGGYYLWVLAKDTIGNTTIIKTNIFNLDNTKPIITMNGNASITVNKSSTYTDAGATASDVDSGINGSVAAVSTVNTSIVGSYTVTYNVSDNAGNAADPIVRTVVVENSIYEYAYTGNYQSITVTRSGTYTIELWGASGGTTATYPRMGAGAYTKGNLYIASGETLYVYVGQRGDTNRTWKFNGGAYGGTPVGSYSGGGSTDVRLTSGTWSDSTSLISRIMVAAGGGGSGGNGTYSSGGAGGYGGVLTGFNGVYFSGHGDQSQYGRGGTQTAGGIGGTNMGTTGTNYAGAFGKGGYSDSVSSANGSGGGGGGYYGGGSGAGTGTGGSGNGAGGGSSFVSGYAGCNAVNSSGTATGQSNHYSGKVFTSTTMVAGNASMPTYDGVSTMIGNVGDGHAKVTFSSAGAVPSVILAGSNPVTIVVGDIYSDAGATASDIEDGDLTNNIETTSTVNPNIVGTYNVTYSVSDNDGNTSSAVRVVNVVKITYTYSYTGNYQTLTSTKSGTYTIELWGASGGTTASYPRMGAGAYTKGNIYIAEGETLYIYVGQKGDTSRTWKFNGGGYGGTPVGSYSGGGSTDVRLTSGTWSDSTSLISRIMVAAGGGGSGGNGTYSSGGAGGYGGVLTGFNGVYYSGHGDLSQYGRGGTQTAGGVGGTNIETTGTNYAGVFGKGGYSDSVSAVNGSGGGGGGYYGGGSGGGTGSGGTGNGAGGGSSFVSGYTGCNAVNSSGTATGQPNHYSGKVFTSTTMVAGNASMSTYDGASTMIGNVGDGYAKVSFIGS